jgi:histidine triad (HIT) family protein
VAPYDPNNIFAQILRHEIPSIRVYEDEATLAIMDIMPRTQGHLLVLPKSPVRTLLDDEAEAILPNLMHTVWHLARAARAAFQANGMTIEQFNERAGGQAIPHLHVHILPCWEGIPLRPPMMHKEDLGILESQAKAIMEHLILAHNPR